MPNNEIAVNQVPTSAEEKKKIDVSIEDDKAVIRMSSFSDGIGWFTQKTIVVNAEMLDELQAKLVEACGKISRESDDILSADVLEF
jgi:hypothetical protein